MKAIIATHTVYLRGQDIHGPPHTISEFFNKNRIENIFIKYPLSSKGYRTIEFYEDGYKIHTEKKFLIRGISHWFHYLREFIVTCKTVLLYERGADLFVGVDPLNALAGAFLRSVGLVKHSVYFSVDYAIERFPGKIQNDMYHALDRMAMRISNQTWSVSKRIITARKKLGLSSSKNLILPNAPFYEDVPRVDFQKTKKHDIVLVSALADGIAFDILFEVVKKLVSQFPDIRLILIGSGPREEELHSLTRALQLDKHIIFKGPLSHEEMFKVLVESGVGIALYDTANNKHYRYFSDPMKVRDYLASGLPVIVSGNSAIGVELEEEGAGFNINADVKPLISSLKTILNNDKKHLIMREKALGLAKKYDTYSLIEKYIQAMNITITENNNSNES